jgi:hypothetical protein
VPIFKKISKSVKYLIPILLPLSLACAQADQIINLDGLQTDITITRFVWKNLKEKSYRIPIYQFGGITPHNKTKSTIYVGHNCDIFIGMSSDQCVWLIEWEAEF